MSRHIVGLEQLKMKLGGTQKAIESGAYKAVGRGTEYARAGAVLLCPVGDGELRQSIKTKVEVQSDRVVGAAYTNKEYAAFVELGTGPAGEANHAGISPEISPTYSQEPWWIHESQVGRETAEKYGWFHIDTPEGRFYRCSGQSAQPFLYPGMKNNESKIEKDVQETIFKEIRKAVT